MSDTPRTDAAIHLPGTIDEWVSIAFARQLERELAELSELNTGHATGYLEMKQKHDTLREGVEKLAEEYTRLADTSDDEDFITEKRALARELRALLK